MHVLIVDDSAVVRQTVAAILQGEPDISTSVAADPLIAMDKMAWKRPDVIVLDIEMPRMDGLTFLRKIMAEDPIPVVVCSAVAGPQSEPAFRALQQGAVEVVSKPRVGLRDFLQESRVLLVDSVRAAAASTMRRTAAARTTSVRVVMPKSRPGTAEDRRVLAIGASTGGTEALRVVLSQLDASAPATVIVQHMPETFTTHFARHLNNVSAMEVREAADGDRLRPGVALLAPGNRHLTVERDGNGRFVHVSDGPLVSRHRPSVDVLFRSVAASAGSDAVGVILTGMGCDGAEGMAEMKRAGALTIAQDERTCVVFGMPREAIARGTVDEVLPLDVIGAAVIERRRC